MFVRVEFPNSAILSEDTPLYTKSKISMQSEFYGYLRNRRVRCAPLPFSRWMPPPTQIYCSGQDDGLKGAQITIERGIFFNNFALEDGGAISATGNFTVVTIEGGIFQGNEAR